MRCRDPIKFTSGHALRLPRRTIVEAVGWEEEEAAGVPTLVVVAVLVGEEEVERDEVEVAVVTSSITTTIQVEGVIMAIMAPAFGVDSLAISQTIVLASSR